MKLYTHIKYYLGIGMILSMLMVACTDENEHEEGDTLELMAYADELHDVDASTRAANVTIPTGYVSYTTLHPEAITESHAIGIYLTVPANENQARYSRFVYEINHWHSYAIVKEDVAYYIYGFLPISGVDYSSITPYQNDYSKGADLTLHGVKSLSDIDVCMLTGLTGVEDVDEDVNVLSGKFYYMGKGRDKNHIYLLFSHLYSAVQFSIRIGTEYSAIRGIRLKSVKLVSQTPETVDVKVGLRPGETPLSNVSFPSKSTSSTEVVLLDTERDLTTTLEPLGSLCYFFSSAAKEMSLESVYDVLDSDGRVVRADCKSTNTLEFLSSLSPGDKRTIKLMVDPTYLYQLSEKDLDNPTIVIQ